ncbi:MAG TPA: hypothetical protein PKZ78_06855 [Candidatus Goldiibacteriota bacterium]|nr:hypothetical protein [Candidatus Goldiibacteriota bacterium]
MAPDVYFRVKGKKKMKVKTSKYSKARLNNVMVASANGGTAVNNVPEIDEVEMVTESEGEIVTPQGTAKTKTQLKDIKVNEDVQFKWLDVKKMREEKKNDRLSKERNY